MSTEPVAVLGRAAPHRVAGSGRTLGPASGAPSLRRALLMIDALSVITAWLAVLLVPSAFGYPSGWSPAHIAIGTSVLTVGTLIVIGWQKLYLARVCGVRAVETAGLGRAAALSGLAAYVVAGALDEPLSPRVVGSGVVLAFVSLTIGRASYGGWLRRVRTQGRYCRPVVLIGSGAEGFELARLVDQHPELGFRLSGVIGDRPDPATWPAGVPWLGELDDAAGALARQGANGVIIAASDVGPDELNRVSRELLEAGAHVHISSGLRGIDHRRLRALPIAHEPLFYLEQNTLSQWQRVLKRSIDVTVSAVLLVLSAPLVAVAALAVKLGDRGPVLFRQARVGLDGRRFTLYKLRTMVPDAEERLVDLTHSNQRQGGPLFKLTADPRRTRVGHVLERTSIDELPQLWNVLRGEMSLVGPRPALPHEVAQFDDDLLARHRVPPGITGLWQVEGRENPEFDVYRRLDLFYVENWSLGLDLAIIFATLQAVFGRVLHQVRLRFVRERPVAIDLEELP